MSRMADLSAWLDSPAGHVFQAECGGYSRALAALTAADQAERTAAFEFNQERQRAGLDPLPAGAALMAVRPRGGPQVTGTTDYVRSRFRDPAWRVRIGTDETEYAPIRWDDRSQSLIDFVSAARRGPAA